MVILLSARIIYIVFMLLGLTSFFADITYEGARSVLGAYIYILGGSAIAAGAIALGEFLGYLARFLGGFIAQIMGSSRALWLLIISGYTINLLAVPALALAGSWDIALALIFVERIGKGLRTPARDVLLADVSTRFGRGKGFGIHELMDQIGAFIGPVFVGYSIGLYGGSYSRAFIALAIPALIALTLIVTASILYPSIRSLTGIGARAGLKRDRELIGFSVAIALLFSGFIHWGLVSYHLKNINILTDQEIGYIYAIAMATDAAVALPVGYLYDRVGPKSILALPATIALIPLILLEGSRIAIYAASAVWGVSMGMIETILRASVPDIVGESRAAIGYGSLGLMQGVGYALGGIAIGSIYSYSMHAIIPYSIAVEALAVASFIYVFRKISL